MADGTDRVRGRPLALDVAIGLLCVVGATAHWLVLRSGPPWAGLVLPALLTLGLGARFARGRRGRGGPLWAEVRARWPQPLLVLLVWAHALGRQAGAAPTAVRPGVLLSGPWRGGGGRGTVALS